VGKILLIDDDPFQCAVVESIVKKMGYDCHCVYSGIEGLTLLKSSHFDIIFLDLNLHEGNGLTHIPRLTELDPDVDIVMLTGESDTDYISQAFAAGVKDYLVKPIKEDRFRQVIQNLLQQKTVQKEQTETLAREEIIGDSPALNQCLERLAISAKGNGNVLITGETGTGKELFARALHNNSDRKDKRYIVVDCTNLPSTLAESLLFGHAKGSFTGADQDRKGLFHLAHGGTLFLDEIGDLDLGIQKSLLRVLQEKTFRPLSSSKEVYSDFRLVAATNRNLENMVARGEFRSDLYYRLQSFIIELPPPARTQRRHRTADPPLPAHPLQGERHGGEGGRSPVHRNPAALRLARQCARVGQRSPCLIAEGSVFQIFEYLPSSPTVTHAARVSGHGR
jgi:two-component system NtrC family response regulator